MARLALRSIAKSFGAVPVLAGVDLEIADGEFLTLVGSSGCGKSTLIRIIAGLEPQTSGSVEIDGRPIDHLRPHERRVALVFQSYALYPHMSAGANIALPLTMQRLSQWERMPLVGHLSPRRRRVMREIGAEVRAVAAQLQIEPLLHRRPSQLSGGQRQRVALGRSMVRHPDVFLMDEPLSNLDAKLRVHMRTELAELHKRLQATFVYVTHDQVEAMTMSDRVAMMDAGSILQLGTPSELYAAPANVRVAQFIGSPAINLLPATVVDGGALDVLGHRLALRTTLAPGTAATIGIRPEAIAPRGTAPVGSHQVALAAVRRRIENLGSEYIVHFDVEGLGGAVVVSRIPADQDPGAAAKTDLVFDLAACHVFDADGRRTEPLDVPRGARNARPRLYLGAAGDA